MTTDILQRQAEPAGDAAMDAVIVGAMKAAENEVYAAIVAECETNNATPGTAEIIMRAVVNDAYSTEFTFAQSKICVGKELQWFHDFDARAAYVAGMKVFYYATLAAVDEAGDAFDAAYATAMK